MLKHIQENSKCTEKAITLIALVITIIVLIILAGVTIATLSGPNGILTNANEATILQAIGTIKEDLKLQQMEKKITNELFTPETLLSEGKVSRINRQKEDGNYELYYVLKEKTQQGMGNLGKGSISSQKDIFLIDEDFHVQYIDKSGKEYGDDVRGRILEDTSIVRFSDAGFSKLISSRFGKPEDQIQFADLKKLNTLTIDRIEITSLEDLLFFPNVESLQIGNWGEWMNLENLHGIEYCGKLRGLAILRVNLKNLEGIESCQNLKTIKMNQFKTEDFSSLMYCYQLDTLEWGESEGDFNESKLIETIKDLELVKNLKINGVKMKSMKELEKLKANLITLNLQDNQITKIEGIQKFTELTTIVLYNNQIEDITPLAKNTQLTSIDLRLNVKIDGNRENYAGEKLIDLTKIGEIIERGGTISIDSDKLKLFTNYKTINLAGQGMTNLENLEGLTQLVSLELANNQLTLEDQKSQEILKSMSQLNYLGLGNNNVSDISCINSLNKLKKLNLAGNTKIELKQIEDKISSLEIGFSNEAFLSLVNCDSTKITKITNIGYEGLTVKVPDLSKFTNLTELVLKNNSGITDFSNLSKLTSLEKLDLSGNRLHERMIDVSKLTNLKTLRLDVNELWSSDLENLKRLKNNMNLIINLTYNSIVDASALLELNPSTKILLGSNLGLSQDSKNKLQARFGNNVTF